MANASASHPRPLFIAGPTAAGKSEVALALASRVGGEIISVDSMQVYRDPATLFVADFVGRINSLPARAQAGGLQVGEQLLQCDAASLQPHASGAEQQCL